MLERDLRGGSPQSPEREELPEAGMCHPIICYFKGSVLHWSVAKSPNNHQGSCFRRTRVAREQNKKKLKYLLPTKLFSCSGVSTSLQWEIHKCWSGKSLAAIKRVVVCLGLLLYPLLKIWAMAFASPQTSLSLKTPLHWEYPGWLN